MKFLSRVLLVLVFSFIVVVIPISIWLQSDVGNEAVNKFISEYIETKSNVDYRVKVEKLRISFPFVIEIKKIILSDKKGDFASIEDFCIHTIPSLLWFLEININKFSAKKINFIRFPDSNTGSVGKLEENRNGMGLFPGVIIREIVVHELVLSPELTVFTEDLAFGLNGHVEIDTKNSKVNFETKLTTISEESGLSDNKFLLLKDSVLEMGGNFDFNNNIINIESFKFFAPHSKIDGGININLSEDSLAGVMNYSSSVLEYFFSERKSLKSSLFGQITFSEKISNPSIAIDGQVYMTDGDLRYFQLPKLNWKSGFVFNDNGVSGQFSLDGGGIKINGEVGKNGHQFFLKNFTVNSGQNLVSTASFLFDSETKIANGILNVNSSNVSEFKEFFPFLNGGKLDIKAIYEQNAFGDKKVDIKGGVGQFSSWFAKMELFDFDLTIKNLEDLKLESASITVRSLFSDYLALKSFSLKAKGAEDFIGITSQIESADRELLNLKINSQLFAGNYLRRKEGNSDIIFRINDVSGTIGKAKIRAQESITVSFDKLLSITASDIKANDGDLNFNLILNDSEIEGKILTKNFPTSVVSKFLTKNLLHSLISGEIELNGPISRPVVNSMLEVSNIQFLDKGNTPVVLKVSSHVDNRNLSINADILQEKQVLSVLNLHMPCKFSLSPFEFSLLKKDNVSANIRFNKEVNLLSLIPLPAGHKLRGHVGGDMNISGNLESPIIRGAISIAKGEYKYQPYGIKLTNISTRIVAQNKNLEFVNFIAQDSYSNLLEASGDLSIYKNFPFKFNINTKKFSLINNSYLQGEIGGTLSIKGDSNKALAKGNFDLGPMEIKIPEHFSDNIPTLNIVETISYDRIVRETRDKPYELGIDIDMNTKKQVYVRGWGVNTLLSGSLKIINHVNDPHIFGKLKSVRGRYQEFGKLLTVREGILTFNGPISPSPYLNIVGVAVSSDTEIRLILSGSIFDPDVSIESTPALSQQEALSLLLFGKNPESISTMQAVALADGMRKLSGKGGGFDPLSLGRKVLGVDDISIKNDEDTESSYVGVGKYLTDKVYIEVEQGNQAFGTKTKIEVEVTPKISVEAITGERGDSSFGLNWRFDY